MSFSPQFFESVIQSPEVDLISSNEVLRKFIEKFESLPELWNQTHPLYTNKVARNHGLDELTKIYSRIKPNCTKEVVKRKINTLRSNYRKELKKILDSKRSGKGTDEVYEPTSWVFHCLKFLNIFEQPVGFQTNLSREKENNESSQSTIAPNDVSGNVERNEEMNLTPVSASRSSILQQAMPPNKKARRSGPVAQQNALIEKALNFLQTGPPTVDTVPPIAKVWGEKLLALESRQRMYAEKAINDILFEAGLENLNRDSVRINENVHLVHTPSSVSAVRETYSQNDVSGINDYIYNSMN